MLKRIFAFACVFVFFSISQAQALDSVQTYTFQCGSNASLKNIALRWTVVPDYFPPDAIVAIIAVDVLTVGLAELCRYNHVYLGRACRKHDVCYSTYGVTREECDFKLRTNWREACKSGYDINFACREACLKMVETMSDYQRHSSEAEEAFRAAQGG